MSDPLAGYTPDWRQKLHDQERGITTQADDPLAGYTPNWRDNINQTGVGDQRLLTAAGRATVDTENRMENVAKLEELLKRPDITPQQRTRIEGMIKQIRPGRFTNPITHKNSGDGYGMLTDVGDAVKAYAGGIVKAGAGLMDLAGGTVNALSPGQPLQGLRDFAHESMAATDEVLPNEGVTGAVSSFAGQITGSIGPYGKMTQATGSALLRVLPEASKAAQLIRAANTGSRLQRIGGQVMMSIPIDAWQAAITENADAADKVKQFLINTGANAIFAGITPAAKSPVDGLVKGDKVDISPEAQAKAEALPGERNTTTQAEIAAAYEKAQALEAERKLVAAAKSDWRESNNASNNQWRKLSADERTKIIEAYKAKTASALPESAPVPEELKPEVVPTPEATVNPEVKASQDRLQVEVDKSMAKVNELKAKMAGGYTGMPDVPAENIQGSDVGNLPEVVKSLEQMNAEAAAAVEKTRGIGAETRISNNLEEPPIGHPTYTLNESFGSEGLDAPGVNERLQDYVTKHVQPDDVTDGFDLKFNDRTFRYTGIDWFEPGAPEPFSPVGRFMEIIQGNDLRGDHSKIGEAADLYIKMDEGERDIIDKLFDAPTGSLHDGNYQRVADRISEMMHLAEMAGNEAGTIESAKIQSVANEAKAAGKRVDPIKDLATIPEADRVGTPDTNLNQGEVSSDLADAIHTNSSNGRDYNFMTSRFRSYSPADYSSAYERLVSEYQALRAAHPEEGRSPEVQKQLTQLSDAIWSLKQMQSFAEHITPTRESEIRDFSKDPNNIIPFGDSPVQAAESQFNNFLRLHAKKSNPNAKLAEEILALADRYTAASERLSEDFNSDASDLEKGVQADRYNQVLSAGMHLTNLAERVEAGEILSAKDLHSIEVLRKLDPTNPASVPEVHKLTVTKKVLGIMGLDNPDNLGARGVTHTTLAGNKGHEISGSPEAIQLLREEIKAKIKQPFLKPDEKRALRSLINKFDEAPVDVPEAKLEVPIRAKPMPVSYDKMNVEQLTQHIDELNDMLDLADNPNVIDKLEAQIKEAAKAKLALVRAGQAEASKPSVIDHMGEQVVQQVNVLNRELSRLNDALVIADPEAKAAIQAQIDEMITQRTAILQQAKQVGTDVVDGKTATVNPSKPAADPVIDVNTISPETRAQWYMMDLTEMPPKVLEAHAQDIVQRIQTLSKADAEPYIKRFNRAKELYIQKTRPGRSDGFMTVNIPPEIGGGLLGYITGSMVGDTDEERQRNAFYGMMLGAGAGLGVRRIHMRYNTTNHTSFPGEDAIKKYVQTAAQREGNNKFEPFLTRLESWYQKIARPVFAAEKATANAGGKNLPAHKNPGKLAAMFGRWISQSEDFIFGRPSMEDANGLSVPITDVANVVEIANMVDGDTETLGNLMAAMTTIEQAGLGKTNSPIPVADAAKFAAAVPQKYHDAAKAARKLNLALVDILVDAGVISPADRAKMATEAWYAPMERVFGAAARPGGTPAPVGAKGSGLSATNPVKARAQGKSTYVIANPFETMVSNIPRMLRAAERNKAKLSMVQLFQANKDAFEGIMWRAPRSPKANTAAFDAQVLALQKELNLSQPSAQAMASAFGEAHLAPDSNTMSVWNNGVVESYRLDPYLAEAYRSLHPAEMSVLWDFIGMPASLARKGIVNNPIFIGYQAFRDNWQATLNSQNGFRFGLDWFHGWREAMRNTPEYKQYLSRGGGNSLYAQREVLTARKTLQSIAVKGTTAEGPALGVFVKQMRTMNFGDAYHTLMTPIAEAARVGEYLRARGAGKSAVEAVYAAKEIVGNFGSIATGIKGLNRVTMFLNPAIKALDQSFYAAGVHFARVPEVGRAVAARRYLLKAFATIVMPTLALKMYNEGDEEIDQLSRTEFGRRFWFMRGPSGDVIKLPKPQFEGQVFGTAAEVAYDAYKEKNPEEFYQWIQAVQNDAAVNLLPVMGVIPYSLAVGRDLNTGSDIVPQGKENLDPELWIKDRTSTLARVVGHTLAPVSSNIKSELWRRALSPVGLDYIVRNVGGTLANEFLQGISVAQNYTMKGYLAPATELPIIRSALVDYPNTSTKDIENFYDGLKVADSKYKTFMNLVQNNPVYALEYYKDNVDWIAKADVYNDVRKDLADMRQQIENIKNMPSDYASPDDRRRMTKEISLSMIRLAKAANLAIREMDK